MISANPWEKKDPQELLVHSYLCSLFFCPFSNPHFQKPDLFTGPPQTLHLGYFFLNSPVLIDIFV